MPEGPASVCTRSPGTAPNLRSFSAVPYRIIDFTLSNCINSGLRRIFIATQYKSLSLNRHIRMGWSIVSEELGEFVEILPPQKRVSEHWYQGTADAVYQNLYSIVQENPQHVIVLSGDHVYKMDYAKMLRFHKERGAAVTLAAIEIPIQEAYRFGVLSVDEQDKVTGFIEKSKNAPSIPGSPDLALGSMGIYIFDTDVLLKALEADAARPSSHDFGKDIIPALITELPTYAYRFYDENKKASKYWRDIGTLDAFYDANMDLCGVDPEFNLYDPEWPMRTYQPQAPPAKFVFAEKGRRCGRGARLDHLAGLHHLGQPRRGQRAVPERPRPQLRRDRAMHADAGRARRAPRAHSPRDHRPRRAHSTRRGHRLQPRRRSKATHCHRPRSRRRHRRRRPAC